MKKTILKVCLGTLGALCIIGALASCDLSLNPIYNNNTTPTTIPTSDIPGAIATITTPTSTEKTYTVTFNSDNGTASNSVIVKDGAKVTKPDTPTKTGYTFDGWYNGNSRFDFNKEINENITLKAFWIKPIVVKTGSIIGGSNKTYDMTFEFKESSFNHDSSIYDKDIASFAMGSSFVNDGSQTTIDFFKGFKFDAVNLPKKEDYDGICFTLARKELDNSELFVASVKGNNYGTEWAGNFDIGKTGNHYDFDKSATTILNALKSYINTNKKTNNIKLLITGYSRGGAVANLLADKVLSETTKITADKNVYVYTFSAPKGILKENAKKYTNVFNIVNNGDIITKLVPDSLGFARCGIDININSSNTDNYLKTYDPQFEIKSFTAKDNYSNEEALTNYLINNALLYDCKGSTEYQKFEIKNRNDFVDNFGEQIKFIMNIVFGVKDLTKAAIMADFMAKYKTNIWSLISIIADATSFHDYIKPFLDNDGIKYNDSDLVKASEAIVGIINTRISVLGPMIMDEAGKNDLIRMIGLHYPIVNYVLFNNFEYQV